MANDPIDGTDPGRNDVDEYLAILGDSKPEKTDEAKYEESLTEDLGYADYRPDAQYLLSEAKSATPNTSAERAVEYTRHQETANDSFDQVSGEEALTFEGRDSG